MGSDRGRLGKVRKKANNFGDNDKEFRDSCEYDEKRQKLGKVE